MAFEYAWKSQTNVGRDLNIVLGELEKYRKQRDARVGGGDDKASWTQARSHIEYEPSIRKKEDLLPVAGNCS